MSGSSVPGSDNASTAERRLIEPGMFDCRRLALAVICESRVKGPRPRLAKWGSLTWSFTSTPSAGTKPRFWGFFLRHYEPFVDRFVILDDGSTDGTLDILRGHPKVELHGFRRSRRDSLVLSMLGVYNERWKDSRGMVDWVIVTNVDEHLYHPHMADYLEDCRSRGVTVVPAVGYQMLAEGFPEPSARLCETITWGAPVASTHKLQIFNPNAVDEINYTVGRHRAWPQGRIRWPDRDEVMNLHYKFLGRDYVQRRHGALGDGLRQTDIKRGWGSHWLCSFPQLEAHWRDLECRAVNIADPKWDPCSALDAACWWRKRRFDWLRSLRWRYRRRRAAPLAAAASA